VQCTKASGALLPSRQVARIAKNFVHPRHDPEVTRVSCIAAARATIRPWSTPTAAFCAASG